MSIGIMFSSSSLLFRVADTPYTYLAFTFLIADQMLHHCFQRKFYPLIEFAFITELFFTMLLWA